jgi:hypothetical protein
VANQVVTHLSTSVDQLLCKELAYAMLQIINWRKRVSTLYESYVPTVRRELHVKLRVVTGLLANIVENLGRQEGIVDSA